MPNNLHSVAGESERQYFVYVLAQRSYTICVIFLYQYFLVLSLIEITFCSPRKAVPVQSSPVPPSQFASASAGSPNLSPNPGEIKKDRALIDLADKDEKRQCFFVYS